MEVHPTSNAENELRLRHCSSDEAVAIFAEAQEGSTISFRAKSANLADDWNLAFATKRAGHFEVFFDKDPENKLIFNNDDESKSLLSANLWEIGWYSLVEEHQNLTSLERIDISNEEKHVTDTEMEEFSLLQEFKGRSFECAKGHYLNQLYSHVHLGKLLCAQTTKFFSTPSHMCFFLLYELKMWKTLWLLYAVQLMTLQHSFPFVRLC